MNTKDNQIVESAEYDVTLTITLRTNVVFSSMLRNGTLSRYDAVNAAINSINEEVWRLLEGDGFSVAFPIEGTAERIA